jgi:hypothetical protein
VGKIYQIKVVYSYPEKYLLRHVIIEGEGVYIDFDPYVQCASFLYSMCCVVE